MTCAIRPPSSSTLTHLQFIDPLPELVAQLAQEAYATDLLFHLTSHLSRFEFESRKDVVAIFTHLLRRQIGSRWPTVEYLCATPDVIFAVLKGYEDEEVALNTGMILRDMLKHEALAKILLYSEEFYLFPHYIETTTFGISCDAYTNLKETLTKHKPMVAEYLEKNYDRFFSSFTTLLMSSNYVTKRQSLKLLGEILLDRANFNVMTRYIANEANLKMMMIMLRDKSRNIQFEAFHVFKVRFTLQYLLKHRVLQGRPVIGRCSSRTRKSHLRSRLSSGATSRSSSTSSGTSTTIRRMSSSPYVPLTVPDVYHMFPRTDV